MAKKVGIEAASAPMKKIKSSKLPKPFKGKALKGPKVGKSGSKPAGGGKKGY